MMHLVSAKVSPTVTLIAGIAEVT